MALTALKRAKKAALVKFLDSAIFLLALLGAWLVACAFAFLSASDLALLIGYYALPFSPFLVPLVIGRLAAKTNWGIASNPAENSSLVQACAGLTAAVSYLLTLAVIGRLLEIPWRQAKFDDPVLSLGFAAAQLYLVFAAAVACSAFLIVKFSSEESRSGQYGKASLGMLAFGSVSYLLVGLSPFVSWRA